MGHMPKNSLVAAFVSSKAKNTQFEFRDEQEVKQEKRKGFFEELAKFLLNSNPLFPIDSAVNNDNFNN